MNNPLSKAEMKRVIEGKGKAKRIPMTYKFWINPTVFGEKEETARELLNTYPHDIDEVLVLMPTVFDEGNGYCWVKKKAPDNVDELGIDAVVAIEDWDELDEVLKNFPDPNDERLFPNKNVDESKYVLGNWWYCFFERLWSLRGMENALTDFYTNPDEVHKLFNALADYYCRVIERTSEELHADGIFTSDDIGTQNSPFFSNAIFEEFFMPYYKRIIEKAHSCGMHFWLHTCGNIESFIPYFAEIGLDVLHPIQKYTMDEKHIAEKYGDKICIWALTFSRLFLTALPTMCETRFVI